MKIEKNPMYTQERRTLGTTAGGSTFMVTLPKAWIEELALQKGESVTLVRVGGGIYLSVPKPTGKGESSTQIQIEASSDREAVGRAIISRYIAGFDVIEIEGQISVEQREFIRSTVERLIGAEILQEKSDYVLIRMLRDPHMLSVSQLLQYIEENAEGMLKDAPQALLDEDSEKAGGIIQRDDRVDRFFLFLSRQLYASFRNPLGEIEQQISRVDFFNMHNVARQLERVADHAVKIAKTTKSLAEEELEVPQEFKATFAKSSEAVRELLTQAVRSFKDLNKAEADGALALTPSIEKLLNEMDRKLLRLSNPHLAFHLGIVVDSIGRVKDYAANIAEVALNAEALQQAV
ncbi:phosphate uptake regulator PhoU [Candidatus Acetothermia bacterium]|nr:phosphate uptake regulator PhoU [Candidatus Acetothermia bacterium]MBI3643575.1 phosphate uptake regulator PhoU [Candidatus Acetothermia bacterium]